MQLGAELQAVLASGLREDSEGVTTARLLLTSVQAQIDKRTAEVAAASSYRAGALGPEEET